MREGLDAPTELPPASGLARTRAFLEGQARIDLAVWVRHEQRGVDGPLFDHHLCLGVVDPPGDLRALEAGIEAEAAPPGWVDLYPLSEVEPLRAFGYVVWERADGVRDGLDPLDFRFSYEAPEVSDAVRDSVRAVAADLTGLVRVGLTVARLWKGDREVYSNTCVSVGWDHGHRPVHDALPRVLSAIRAAGDVSTANIGGSLGAPRRPDETETTIFDAETSVTA
jgi:hypothetical protein